VGATIDACLPFNFVSPDEWHRQHTQDNKSLTPRAHPSNGKTLSTALKVFKQSIVKPAQSGGKFAGVQFTPVKTLKRFLGSSSPSRSKATDKPVRDNVGRRGPNSTRVS
jgi:hypothetical protein